MQKEHFKKLDADSVKWEEFAGKKNSKDVVLSKASALARIMFSLLGQAIKAMQESIISENEIRISDECWWSVYYDLLLYMMHITDRETFEYLKESMRDIFMEQLFKEVMELCLADFDNNSQIQQFEQTFANNFMLFQNEFSSYERGQTEYLTENLAYMFAKRIKKRLGSNRDLAFILQFVKFSIELELLLDIPRLLNDTFD